MNSFLIKSVPLLVLTSVTFARAGESELAPNASGFTQTAIQQSEPSGFLAMKALSDFGDRLEAALKTRKLSEIMALYRTNAGPDADLTAEQVQWRPLLLQNPDGNIAMFGKELATLPSKEARSYWSNYAQRLTKRPVTHILMVGFEGGRRVVLPLVLHKDRLWIVPFDESHRRIEPGRAADGSTAIHSETNQTPSSPGNQR
jgi:hypothetical protein